MYKIIFMMAVLNGITAASQAQLINYKDELQPGVSKVSIKYFNGSGGKGFSSINILDSLGRIVEKKSYKKGKLLEKDEFVYNMRNDIVQVVYTYMIDKDHSTDTTKYRYVYNDNFISHQSCLFANNDSTIFNLISNDGDSIITYQNISYHYINDKKINNTVERRYTLFYQKNFIVKQELIDFDNRQVTTYFEYDKHGRLQHRKIIRVPDYAMKNVYVGGPGGDDQFYSYSLNKKGKVKTYNTVVGNKTYKLATYTYKKN